MGFLIVFASLEMLPPSGGYYSDCDDRKNEHRDQILLLLVFISFHLF